MQGCSDVGISLPMLILEYEGGRGYSYVWAFFWVFAGLRFGFSVRVWGFYIYMYVFYRHLLGRSY